MLNAKLRSLCYVLDSERRPLPCPDVVKWAEWMESADRAVGRSVGDGWELRTSFIGTDLNHYPDGDPITFESIIEYEGGTMVVARYETWDEAAAGHAEYATGLLSEFPPAGL